MLLFLRPYNVNKVVNDNLKMALPLPYKKAGLHCTICLFGFPLIKFNSAVVVLFVKNGYLFRWSNISYISAAMTLTNISGNQD